MPEASKVRVLIVDDVAETRETVRKLLQFEKDIEVVAAVGTGKAGIDTAKELDPDVVLMDINMPDMDGIKATEMIRKNNPVTQIVILSVQGDPNYMRRAMLAGARDFITKPPIADELIAAIRRAGLMAIAEREKISEREEQIAIRVTGGLSLPVTLGKIITVYAPKGGIGATTVAVNLAVTLNNDETPVVIVDGNLQYGDVHVFLNERVRNSVSDLAPRADELDADVLNEVLITHSSSGLKMLAAPPKPEYAENISGDQFAKVLKYLQKMYSYVIVDTSSTLTDAVVAALDASDLILLLTTQEIPAIKNARLFLDLATVMGLEQKRIMFIMNRYDKRIGITPEKIGESFKHPIESIIPLEERVVIPSVNRGVPFMLGDRSKPIARSMLFTAERIRKKITELSKLEQQMEI